MSVKTSRGFQISGVPMIDPKGRWYLLHATGERPLAPMELGITQAPLADGAFFPRDRGRLGSSQMALQLHVTDAGRGQGGRTQRDRNLADLYNALQVGRETTVSMMIAGQLCSQRCVVTAGSSTEEHSPGLLKVSLVLTLLEGVWKAEPEEELVTGGTLATLSGCTGPARPMWSVKGPVSGLEIRQADRQVCVWGGSLPAGARLATLFSGGTRLPASMSPPSRSAKPNHYCLTPWASMSSPPVWTAQKTLLASSAPMCQQRTYK